MVKTYQITIVVEESRLPLVQSAIRSLDESIRVQSELIEIPFEQIESQTIGGYHGISKRASID